MKAAIMVVYVWLGLGAVNLASAQQPAERPSYERAVPGRLLSQAKVGEDSARVLALAKVPGTVESVELLREGGKLLWVWDVKVTGKRGITEVSVDAITGKVTSHEE
jgi:uncharacterized membrane protein YkoI